MGIFTNLSVDANLAVDDGAAVRMQHLARHVRAIVAGEEQEGWCDLVRLARTTHRRILAEILDLLRRLAPKWIERSPDRTRSDSVHANPVLDQVFRQGTGECGDRTLGRG